MLLVSLCSIWSHTFKHLHDLRLEDCIQTFHLVLSLHFVLVNQRENATNLLLVGVLSPDVQTQSMLKLLDVGPVLVVQNNLLLDVLRSVM